MLRTLYIFISIGVIFGYKILFQFIFYLKEATAFCLLIVHTQYLQYLQYATVIIIIL